MSPSGWLLVALALAPCASAVAQQAPFAPAKAPGEAPREVAFGAGQRLALRDGRVLLVRGAVSEPVPCTRPGGPGEAHALTTTSFGQVVVGADEGLFVLDPDHPVLDALDVRDGVPAGPVLGVHGDGRARLWLCTADAFAVVDVRHGYGHTFTAADGAPPQPYTGLAADGRRLLLQTAAGAFVYRPDVGPAPRPAGGAVSQLALDAVDGRVRIEAAVEASGPVSLRARRRNHHLFVPLDDGVLGGLRPGRHVVEVFAVDRDLRRARVASARVHAPLPQRYSTRWLPISAAVGALAVAALAWPRNGRRRVRRLVFRTGVACVVGLQLLAAVLGYGRSWPFMGFSMYTENYHEGSLLYRPEVRARLANGDVIVLEEWQMGLHQDGYWQQLAEIVYGGERRLEQLLEASRRLRDRGIEGFEFVDTRIRLTRDGPVDVAPTVIRRWRWQP